MQLKNYTPEQIAKMMRAKLIQKGSAITIENLLLDSRKLVFPESSLFFALKGGRRNGHLFIDELYEKGVRSFVVSDELDLQKYPKGNFFGTKNTTIALQNLTATHRKNYNLPVIGITGSNGKTIVKEWLHQLLEPDYSIVRSPKSYNSQIGVPLSVWQIADYHNLGIFEAGVSQPDEMANLEKVIQPTIGIFTNIGNAHNEGFLNIRQKVNEKLKLFVRADILIYCRDYADINECLAIVKDRMKRADSDFNGFKTFSWTKKELDADVAIKSIEKKNSYTEITAVYQQEDYSFTIPLTDDASIENAIHCWMTLMYLKVDPVTIANRMSALSMIAMRLELKDAVNNCSLINDSYNSDLNALGIAIDFLNQQKQHRRRTLILSDILQSGMADGELYEEVAEMASSKGINRLIGIGKSIGKQQKIFNNKENLLASFYPSTDDFLKSFNSDEFHDETILLKGARSFEFERISKKLEQKQHETVLEINLNSLLHNLSVYQSLLKPETKMMVMVKAFSYGSGSFEIANVLQFHKVDYLAVAYADEGIALRKSGISMPIMVMNPEPRSFEAIIHYQLEPEMYSLKELKQFMTVAEGVKEKYPDGYPIHLEVETGMHRLGFDEENFDELISLLRQNNSVKVQSIFSHLAASEDVAMEDYSKGQIEKFESASKQITDAVGYPVIRHILNSAGIVRFPQAHFDMVRLGLGIYGIDYSQKLEGKLKNVSTLKTTVSQIKYLKAGETVGYGRAGTVTRDTVVATVGIGYADGLSRRLSCGIGKMMIKNQPAPILGNICMDMTMLDVTDIPNVEEGDDVIVFGEELPLKALAGWSGTIPYEVMTTISQRVRRVYFQE